MSTLLMDRRSSTGNDVFCSHHKNALKSRENIFKSKCNKSLKRKLKKYKLRRDGIEDPDILDVSQTLINSLKIKSPQNINSQKLSESEENRPKNYLSKMVRLKKTKNSIKETINEVEDENTSLASQSDQEKKQTDAFKLLMDSRNKSIGSNSPGKEKAEEECDMQERIEKKEIKAKRILSLKKMAQAKGSLKKEEIEEYREESVKRKMEKRARRLKNMIVSTKTKHKKSSEVSCCIIKEPEETVSSTTQEVNKNGDTLNNKGSILKTFDNFKDLNGTETNTIKKISKEDEEFLNKLSPSLKKKENMLCYFQKVNKDSETLETDFENNSQDEGQLIIKVKFTPKRKSKKKNNKHVSDIQINTDNINHGLGSSLNDNSKVKENANIKETNDKVTNSNVSGLDQCNGDSRPKRKTKRPIKYTDDLQLSSSDEELHIFTPKKKRKERHDHQNTFRASDNNNSLQTNNAISNTTEANVKHKQKKNIKKVDSPQKIPDLQKSKIENVAEFKKTVKLAPIFVSKPQLDPAVLEAKQKFLQSGVPKQLKKNCIQQTNMSPTSEFQSVVHVQNLTYINIAKKSDTFNLLYRNFTEDIQLREEENLFKKLLYPTVGDNYSMPNLKLNIDEVLKNIKMSYPKFPVYRTYNLLKGKRKGEFKDCFYPDLDNSVEILNSVLDVNNINPDKLNWSDKYKPTTEKQVIGNFESIKELKRWLVSWTESNAKSKCNLDNGSDTSEFYQSDTSSRESMKNDNNLLIITGKVGSGKTLSVYAVAAELAIKVIEVNASTKRTGKIMLQDLHEATQSHKVNRGKSSTECSQKSQELSICDNPLKVLKKRGRKKKNKDSVTHVSTNKNESTEVIINNENVRTGMSLILIDDADIVFDQDDGFCSAISHLIQSSKRPVILVTSSLTYPHLQKFLHIAKVIKMRQFLPRMLGTWLDIMCLVDTDMCSPGLGAKTLEVFKGDIRKAINHLQFYMTSHKYLCNVEATEDSSSQVEQNLKINDDENSCMSWVENDGWSDENPGAVKLDDNSVEYFVKKQLQLLQPLDAFDTFNIWWSLPKLLNYSLTCRVKNDNNLHIEKKKSNDIMKLNTIAEMLNTISIVDDLENSRQSNDEITSRPWYSYESASVIDSENFNAYNRNDEFINDIKYELMTKGVSEVQRVLHCTDTEEYQYSNILIQSERDKAVSRHNTLTTYLSPSAVLDRRALALDYWPSCRSICRTEKIKTDNNSKRNNRFCHYLKSLNILCKNEFFDHLGESLSSNCKL